MANETEPKFNMWGIIELFGHRRLAGQLSETQVAGRGFIRIDIPTKEGPVTTFYGPDAVYSMTPTSEQIARAVAGEIQDVPVHPWEVQHVLDQRGIPGNRPAGVFDRMLGLQHAIDQPINGSGQDSYDEE